MINKIVSKLTRVLLFMAALCVYVLCYAWIFIVELAPTLLCSTFIAIAYAKNCFTLYPIITWTGFVVLMFLAFITAYAGLSKLLSAKNIETMKERLDIVVSILSDNDLL